MSEPLLLFRLEKKCYAMPLPAVEQVVSVLDITSLPKGSEDLLGLINVQGEVLPVINLRRKLNLPERELELEDYFVFVRDDAGSFAMVVDGIEGICERKILEITSFEKILFTSEITAGSLIIAKDIVFLPGFAQSGHFDYKAGAAALSCREREQDFDEVFSFLRRRAPEELLPPAEELPVGRLVEVMTGLLPYLEAGRGRSQSLSKLF
ncbi:MAG: chemotaxis protein CheW [Deltaproteobacteria bacterium]|nr:chemotaxis protein CheW [Deltaproteobacteria bacterium]